MFVEIRHLFQECDTFDSAIPILDVSKPSFLLFIRTGLMMRLEATWLLYLVFHVQIGTKRHSEELIRALWVFIDIFGHLLVMIVMKDGITMNCFETLIKNEYSNTFFAALSFVCTEIGLFFARFVDNRDDKECLLGLGVYIEIECTTFACFGLSLYADKKYVSNTTIKFNKRQKKSR